MSILYYDYKAVGVWRSLVARSAGGREVASSNLVTPIKQAAACMMRQPVTLLFLFQLILFPNTLIIQIHPNGQIHSAQPRR